MIVGGRADEGQLMDAGNRYCVWRRYLGDMRWFADEKSHDDVQSRTFLTGGMLWITKRT